MRIQACCSNSMFQNSLWLLASRFSLGCWFHAFLLASASGLGLEASGFCSQIGGSQVFMSCSDDSSLSLLLGQLLQVSSGNWRKVQDSFLLSNRLLLETSSVAVGFLWMLSEPSEKWWDQCALQGAWVMRPPCALLLAFACGVRHALRMILLLSCLPVFAAPSSLFPAGKVFGQNSTLLENFSSLFRQHGMLSPAKIWTLSGMENGCWKIGRACGNAAGFPPLRPPQAS